MKEFDILFRTGIFNLLEKRRFMFSSVNSAFVLGIEGVMIQVETDVSDGLPVFEMVGFLASETKESKERVRTALKNSGYKIPPKRLVVNLSPADMRKGGTGFDLPIAISILCSLGIIPTDKLEDTLTVSYTHLDVYKRQILGLHNMENVMAAVAMAECIGVPMDKIRETITSFMGCLLYTSVSGHTY